MIPTSQCGEGRGSSSCASAKTPHSWVRTILLVTFPSLRCDRVSLMVFCLIGSCQRRNGRALRRLTGSWMMISVGAGFSGCLRSSLQIHVEEGWYAPVAIAVYKLSYWCWRLSGRSLFEFDPFDTASASFGWLNRIGLTVVGRRDGKNRNKVPFNCSYKTVCWHAVDVNGQPQPNKIWIYLILNNV
jgi:hypothetical protein